MYKHTGKEKEVVSFFRADLAYEHLHNIKLSVSNYAGANDLIGWYNALETEYRFIWAYIETHAKKNKHDKDFFENNWLRIRNLIYDRRIELDTPAADRLKFKNYSIARQVLHEINMLINEYEKKAHLIITTEYAKDPSRAMESYGG